MNQRLVTPILNYVYLSTHTGQEANIAPVIYKTQVTILEFEDPYFKMIMDKLAVI